MITQFFGSYLLNHGFVTGPQLSRAIEEKNTVRMKLGVLAINSGFMTAEQVELVNIEQANRDMRFGDLAVEMGYITPKQVDTLLSEQPRGHILVGQALVNAGVMTNAQLAQAINDYKAAHQLTDDDISNEQNEKIAMLVSSFYNIGEEKNSELLTKYISLLIKNLIRFIGDDFVPLEATVIKSYKSDRLVSQRIGGDASGFVGLDTDFKTYNTLAERFAKEAIDDSSYADAAIGEFLNLNDGLFTVNMSNDLNLELTLTPQECSSKETLEFSSHAFCVPIRYNFGTANFIISIDGSDVGAD